MSFRDLHLHHRRRDCSLANGRGTWISSWTWLFLDNPSCFLVGAKVKSDAIMKILRKWLKTLNNTLEPIWGRNMKKRKASLGYYLGSEGITSSCGSNCGRDFLRGCNLYGFLDSWPSKPPPVSAPLLPLKPVTICNIMVIPGQKSSPNDVPRSQINGNQ